LLRKIEPLPDRELCTQYAAFEGMRQLPPLPLPHSVIAARRAGRYSVWNQRLFYAASDEQSGSRSVWLVENSDRTRRMLSISPRHCGRLHVRPKRRRELLNELLATEVSNLELRPGDPVVVCTHGLPAGGAERQ